MGEGGGQRKLNALPFRSFSSRQKKRLRALHTIILTTRVKHADHAERSPHRVLQIHHPFMYIRARHPTALR